MSEASPVRNQPQALRRVALMLLTMAVAMLAIGLALWASADSDSPVRMVGLALCGIGVLDLVGSLALLRVATRRSAGSGYDGRPVTYEPGDRPPGML